MQHCIQYIKRELAGIYPPEEIESFIMLLFEHLLGIDRTAYLLRKNERIGEGERKRIEQVVERLKCEEPIQYILGEAEFYGLPFKVAPEVLIPRPETEELVDRVIRENKQAAPRVLDIGTGSGCIAITLGHNIAGSVVTAIDISSKAIKIAQDNAKVNGVAVEFIHADILQWQQLKIDRRFDIIVSNPPYVRYSEQAKMKRNVLGYEPGTALFVEDNDPLLFYRAIADFGKQYLVEGGSLYFEINEAFGTTVAAMLKEKGYIRVEVIRDINGKDRMIRCRKAG